MTLREKLAQQAAKILGHTQNAIAKNKEMVLDKSKLGVEEAAVEELQKNLYYQGKKALGGADVYFKLNKRGKETSPTYTVRTHFVFYSEIPMIRENGTVYATNIVNEVANYWNNNPQMGQIYVNPNNQNLGTFFKTAGPIDTNYSNKPYPIIFDLKGEFLDISPEDNGQAIIETKAREGIKNGINYVFIHLNDIDPDNWENDPINSFSHSWANGCIGSWTIYPKVATYAHEYGHLLGWMMHDNNVYGDNEDAATHPCPEKVSIMNGPSPNRRVDPKDMGFLNFGVELSRIPIVSPSFYGACGVIMEDFSVTTNATAIKTIGVKRKPVYLTMANRIDEKNKNEC